MARSPSTYSVVASTVPSIVFLVRAAMNLISYTWSETKFATAAPTGPAGASPQYGPLIVPANSAASATLSP